MDVKVFQSNNGGNVTIPDNDDIFLTGGFETEFYMALFGGDERDDGREGNQFNLWCNLMEDDPAYQYRSKTQNLLIGLPLVSGNLRRIEDAVRSDLQYCVNCGAISELSVSVSVISVRRVKITINAFADGEKINVNFLVNWQAMEQEYA